MTPDYSDYSIQELQESLAAVDGTRYPENKKAIEAEIAKRGTSRSAEREVEELKQAARTAALSRKEIASKLRIAFGCYLMVTAPFVGYSFNLRLPEAVSWLVVVLTGICVAYVVSSLVAGYALLRDKAWGHRLAVGVIVPQLIQVESESLLFYLSSALGLFLTVTGDGSIGVTATYRAGFDLLIPGESSIFRLGINVFAIAALATLFIAHDKVE